MQGFIAIALFVSGIGIAGLCVACWGMGRRTGWERRKQYDGRKRVSFERGVEALANHPDRPAYELNHNHTAESRRIDVTA